MLLQGVSLKAVRRRVKVVVANAADETLGLQREMKSNSIFFFNLFLTVCHFLSFLKTGSNV